MRPSSAVSSPLRVARARAVLGTLPRPIFGSCQSSVWDFERGHVNTPPRWLATCRAQTSKWTLGSLCRFDMSAPTAHVRRQRRCVRQANEAEAMGLPDCPPGIVKSLESLSVLVSPSTSHLAIGFPTGCLDRWNDAMRQWHWHLFSPSSQTTCLSSRFSNRPHPCGPYRARSPRRAGVVKRVSPRCLGEKKSDDTSKTML